MSPPSEGLARSAGIAGAATLTSRILGLVREQVLAAIFGAGNEMDAFVVAFRIPNLVRTLLAEGAMSAALVPTFTHHLTRHGRTDAWRLASNLLTMLVLITGLLVLATPIVRLLFERGHFAASDTASTAAALRLYAVGLVGYSTARIASPVFYAVGRSRIPVAVSVLSIAVNIGASVALVRVMGFRGLALGTSLAAIANGTVLLWFLGRHLRGLDGGRLLTTSAKIVVAAAVMAGMAVIVERAATEVAPGSATIVQAVRLSVAIGSALVALAGSAKLLRVDEFDEALARVRLQVRKLLAA